LAIKSKETMAVLERWQFNIQNTKDHIASTQSQPLPSSSPFSSISSSSSTAISGVGAGTGASSPSSSDPPHEKTEKEIQAEIQVIMRQITASVTFLPLLDEKCKSQPSVVSCFRHWNCSFSLHVLMNLTSRHLGQLRYMDNLVSDRKRCRGTGNMD
jgi:hypothetical protein